MNYNPIRRSPLRKKPKPHRESWRSGKIRLNGPEMGILRQNAFQRSGGQCENSFNGKRCATRIYWGSFHLAHIISRGRGGSDIPENVLATCPECHYDDTRNGHKLEPHQDWIAAA